MTREGCRGEDKYLLKAGVMKSGSREDGSFWKKEHPDSYEDVQHVVGKGDLVCCGKEHRGVVLM